MQTKQSVICGCVTKMQKEQFKHIKPLTQIELVKAIGIKTLFNMEQVFNIKGNIGLYRSKYGSMVLQLFPDSDILENSEVIKAFLELARVKGLKVVSCTTGTQTTIEQFFKAELFPQI
jgi:hypothetical protein